MTSTATPDPQDVPVDQPQGEVTAPDDSADAPGTAGPANDAQNDDSAADAPDADSTADADDVPDDLRSARREAANRRKELRTAEGQITELQGTVSNLQRQVAEQLIANDDTLPWMHRPADLFEIGDITTADLADDAGGIDPDKLATALTTLQSERPYLFGSRPTSGYPLFESMMRQGTPAPEPSTDPAAAWSKALRSQ